MVEQDRPRGSTARQEQEYWQARLDGGDYSFEERMQIKVWLAELERELGGPQSV